MPDTYANCGNTYGYVSIVLWPYPCPTPLVELLKTHNHVGDVILHFDTDGGEGYTVQAHNVRLGLHGVDDPRGQDRRRPQSSL